MQRFKFNLETLLRLRKIREDEALLAVAKEARRLQEIGQSLSRTGEAYRETVTALMKLGQSRDLDVESVRAARLYGYTLMMKMSRLESSLRETAETHARLQKVLEKAMSERKAIEQLRGRRWEEYRKCLLREEGKVLDEIGAGMALRRKGEEREGA
ncbi:MAG: flagellar FliJ family protein [Planctomycetota bacterium]